MKSSELSKRTRNYTHISSLKRDIHIMDDGNFYFYQKVGNLPWSVISEFKIVSSYSHK